MLLSLLPLFFQLASAQNVVKSWTGVKATAYYDLEHIDKCFYANGGPWPPQWYETINNGYTSCQGSGTTTYTLNSLGSNRIVAMDLNTDGKGPEYWCGKEVQIFGADGKEIVLDEGPFVVYDNCGACGGGKIIDVSAKAFVQIKNGYCGGDNPTGLTVKVLDRNVSPSGKIGSSGPAPTTSKAQSSAATSKSTSKASSTVATSTAKVTSSTAKVTSSTAKATSSTATVTSSTAKATSSTAKATSTSSTKTKTKTSTTSTATRTFSTSTPQLTGGAFPPSWVDDDEWEYVCEEWEDVPTTAPTSSSKPTTTKTSTAPSRLTDATLPADGNFAVNVPSSCTFGKYVCDGRVLKICNYVTWRDLGWQVITTCPMSCTFKGANGDQLECI